MSHSRELLGWRQGAGRLTNLGLRMGALVSKFIFLIIVARYWSPEDVGLYSLIVVGVSYSCYLLGADYYCNAHRLFLGSGVRARSVAMSEHLAVLIASSLVFTMLCVGLSFFIEFPVSILISVTLVLSELANTELSRYLILKKKQLAVSAALFARHGIYSVTLILFLAGGVILPLDVILSVWVLSSVCASLLLLCKLRKASVFSISRRWVSAAGIRRGAGVASVFLFGTLMMRGLFSFDRFLVGYWFDVGQVGVYAFFAGIAAASIAAYDALFGVYLLPKAFELKYSFSRAKLRHYVVRNLADCIALYSVVAIVFLFSSSYMLKFVGRPEYIDSSYILWYSLLSAFLYSSGNIFHGLCYVFGGRDLVLSLSAAAALLVFIVGSSLFVNRLGFTSILISLNAAFLVLFLLKAFLCASVADAN